jgi:hypothetical protein
VTEQYSRAICLLEQDAHAPHEHPA